MRKFALAVGLSAALLSGFATIPAFAFDENSTAAINVDESGLGLRGYDPVGYFEAGAPTKGSADLTAEHNGVTYHFASSENRDLFTANPSKYAPAVWWLLPDGCSTRQKTDGDPAVWRIDGDKLFVYAYPAAKEGFVQDIPGNTQKADTNWPVIKDKAPKDL
jgi:YHS domain-containing protein